jgi:hydroxyacylglutathione hydrolase
LDQIDGYLAGGIGAWERAGYDLAHLEPISVQTLQKQVNSSQPLQILDVRTENEWLTGHIENAIHIHGGELKDRIDQLPKDQPIAVLCGSGYRASIAASLLKSHGHEHVMPVLGGMSGWAAAGLPTVTDEQKQAA